MICMDPSAVTLESVLQDPNSSQFQQFTAYLDQSYCMENLGFWLAAQRYKACQEQDLINECKYIIHHYILPNSPQEINIPCDMRETIIHYYNNGYYDPAIFEPAADSILELMRVNSFLPWLMNSWSSSSTSSSICSSPTTATCNDSSNSSNSSNNPHTSWPIIPINNNILMISNNDNNNSTSSTSSSKNKKKTELSSSTSLAALSSFSISDKWQMIKTKQLSRRSCSSLDESRLSSSSQQTVSFLTTSNEETTDITATATILTPGRYKSMLKKVKRSLLGHSAEPQNMDDTPLTVDPSWAYWSKTQHS